MMTAAEARCGCQDCRGGRSAAGQPSPANPPGRDRLALRVGTHDAFLRAMREAVGAAVPEALRALKARRADDPTIAVMDAWAVVLDVLAFYNERIAEEGYLGTARDRASLVELAKLVGYAPRPGVAATGWLAFEVEAPAAAAAPDGGAVRIPARTRVNSVPGPGEAVVTFETDAVLLARSDWNRWLARRTEPQSRASIEDRGLVLAGVAHGLRAGDPLLVDPGTGEPELRRIAAVRLDGPADRTEVTLVRQAPPAPDGPPAGSGRRTLVELLGAAAREATPLPTAVRRDPAALLTAEGAEGPPRLLGALDPQLGRALGGARRGWRQPDPRPVRAWALRATAALFGHNAQPRQITVRTVTVPTPPPINVAAPPDAAAAAPSSATEEIAIRQEPWPIEPDGPHADPQRLHLDQRYPVLPGSHIVIERRPVFTGEDWARDDTPLVVPLADGAVSEESFAAFGITGTSTVIALPDGSPWRVGSAGPDPAPLPGLDVVRPVRVHCVSEVLPLAEVPIAAAVAAGRGGEGIDLDGLVEGVEAGRVVCARGDRADILDGAGRPIPGIAAAELARIERVEHVQTPAEGGAPYSRLHLAAPLAFAYARASFEVLANLAPASHGETRRRILGSGDPGQPMQAFGVGPAPIGQVLAPVPRGTATTLEVRVAEGAAAAPERGVRWRAVAGLDGAAPDDRVYVVEPKPDGSLEVACGDGRHGARWPAGRENVAASWRDGLGPAGNARAGTLTVPVDRPLGLRNVTNPVPGTGGAGPDGAEALRRRVPIGAGALDRLVSVADYRDFALDFAGIAKAQATLHEGRGRPLVHVTVAGNDDMDLPASGELLRALGQALRRWGDPDLALGVAPRERLALVVAAGLAVEPDHAFATVAEAARVALLARFGFERVELGEDLYAAVAVAALAGVQGVRAVDLRVFDTLDRAALAAAFAGRTGAPPLAARDRVLVLPARRAGDGVAPAQLAYLADDLRDTILLEEMPA